MRSARMGHPKKHHHVRKPGLVGFRSLGWGRVLYLFTCRAIRFNGLGRGIHLITSELSLPLCLTLAVGSSETLLLLLSLEVRRSFGRQIGLLGKWVYGATRQASTTVLDVAPQHHAPMSARHRHFPEDSGGGHSETGKIGAPARELPGPRICDSSMPLDVSSLLDVLRSGHGLHEGVRTGLHQLPLLSLHLRHARDVVFHLRHG